MPVTNLFFATLLGGIYCLIGYMLVFKPMSYLEWGVNKPWKGFGVRVIVEDERKMRRAFRGLGLVFWVLGIAAAGFLLYTGRK